MGGCPPSRTADMTVKRVMPERNAWNRRGKHVWQYLPNGELRNPCWRARFNRGLAARGGGEGANAGCFPSAGVRSDVSAQPRLAARAARSELPLHPPLPPLP